MTQDKFNNIKNKIVWCNTYNYAILLILIAFTFLFYPGPFFDVNQYQILSGLGILAFIFMIHAWRAFKFHGLGVIPAKGVIRPTTFHKKDFYTIPKTDFNLMITGGFDYLSFSPRGKEYYILFKDKKYIDWHPTGIILRGKLWSLSREKLKSNKSIYNYLNKFKGFSMKTIKQSKVLTIHDEYVEPPKENGNDIKKTYPLHSEELKDLRSKYKEKVKEEEIRRRRFKKEMRKEVESFESP